MCQRLDVWEKFVKCLSNMFRELKDKTIKYKPVRNNEFLSILTLLYNAMKLSNGLNIPCHLVSELLESNICLIVDAVKISKEFVNFNILPLYKNFVGKRNESLEKAIFVKLEVVGPRLKFQDLISIFKLYSSYYQDSDNKEFSVLGKKNSDYFRKVIY